MDDYISKPLRLEKLVAALKKVPPLVSTACLEFDSIDASGRITEPIDPQIRQASMEESIASTVQPGAADASNVLDIEALKLYFEPLGGIESDAFESVRDLFWTEAEELKATLLKAIAEKDPEKIEFAAHSLKSSSASLGAISLSSFCLELEQSGRAKIEIQPEKGEQLQVEIKKFKDALAEV